MNLNSTFFSIAFLICVFSFSQSFNYKAIVKDDNGNIVANTSLSIQFNIYEGAALTNNVYRELHTPTTDDNGLIIIDIGEGTTTDVFTDINWNNDSHFLNVQIDTGSGYVDLGTTQFKSVPYARVAGNVSGLETIDEGNGIGWRLVGSDPANFGTIGSGAIDLSVSNLNSSTYGATATNSTAIGVRVSSNGDSSITLGSDSIASDDFSTAIGAGVTASGASSTALGVGTQATENSATAIGYFTNASGFASTSLGYFSEASGSYATAIGYYTSAAAHNSIAIGRYNVGGGSPTQWIDQDPLFEIGNGTSNSVRRNALTVSKSGLHTINSNSTGININAEVYGLAITNPGNSGILITDPGSNGIIISGATSDGITISADDDGLVVFAEDEGAIISGNSVGVYASGGHPTQSDVPDIILGSPSSSGFSDDGIISTNPERLGSDMFLRSYDAVVVQLDYDNNETGNFRIRDGNQDVVFDVTEIGNVNMEGRLRLGDETIEDTGVDRLEFNAHLIPDNDNEFVLGWIDHRWLGVFAVNGTINTSDRREKKNIEDLNYGLAEVLQMQPVSFNWKNKNNPDAKLGLIAQNLQTLIPEVVMSHAWEKDKATGTLTKKELDRLGVYYSDLVPVLIKAIQEQQDTIEALKSTIQNTNNTIKNQEQFNTKQSKVLEALLSRVQALEQSNN